eukprot:365608-Chlamydomonas_euryale.AAC.5
MTTCSAAGQDQLISWLASSANKTHARGSDHEDSMLIMDRLCSGRSLRTALTGAQRLLGSYDDTAPYSDVADEMAQLGFGCGWGRDVCSIKNTLGMLEDVLQAPGPEGLESLLARVPTITSIVLVCPHGYFGQDNVLGPLGDRLPEAGGIVVYLLNAVRALEAEMKRRLVAAGRSAHLARILLVTRLIPEACGTTCDQSWEPVSGTDSAFILRVPFRRKNGMVLRKWMSRWVPWVHARGVCRAVQCAWAAPFGMQRAIRYGTRHSAWDAPWGASWGML